MAMDLENRVFHLLVLEDDLADQELIERHFVRSRHNFQLTWATKLAEALAHLKEQPFDAIVSDVNVPDSSGFETIARLREHCGQSAIFVLTSQEDNDVEDEIFGAGAQDYRGKEELSSNSLGRAVVHAIQRQEQVNQNKRLVRRLKRNRMQMNLQAQQLKRKNRRLSKLYRTTREFVDNVSHDLRTPLTVIKDYVSIVRDGMAGPIGEEQKKLLGKVAIRADDLNHMVDDILDASKLEAGLLGAWRRTASVAQIIDHASCGLRERASIKGVELVIDCPQNLPEAYCDCEKAVRVINNLAINAIKHSNAGQSVTIWAKYCPIEGEISIGITDHGPGIEPESLQCIFDRFEQLDDNVSTTVQGFGLGLNIAQRLTLINLGKLSVESKVGEGSTFSFTVPLADPSEVFSRWLDIRSDSNLPLKAIEIAVGDMVTDNDADDFDRFVNCLLRRQDILFRVSKRHWLLVLAIPENDMVHWEERAQRDFVRFNRNRPQGPLPGFTRRLVRQWASKSSARKILGDFDHILREEFEMPEYHQLAAH
ncbi:hybrid sensor histidine kinase/response regulator [Bremerella sp. JC817]|uniref:hybrid sensor histidine kinase/response regulator n=1 Tax=Bremerella sp. JC817 TaxID=3231756 RepID=UPI00345812CC